MPAGYVRRAVPVVRCLAVVAVAVLSGCAGAGRTTASRPTPVLAPSDVAFLDTLERRTFDWFWETTNPRNGLTPDRSPNPPFASIAAVGFALTAYPIGAERRYITRAGGRANARHAAVFLARAAGS
jgi:hypothetical protein